MQNNQEDNWKAIIGLVGEVKRCEDCNLTTASVAMAYICIDALASLGRPENKDKVTRSDFIDWVDSHLEGDPAQPYQYRGKDVYAARCAFLHTYGAEAELHQKDPDITKYVYHDGGKHNYDPNVNPNLVIIATKSFTNDVVHAVSSFLEECKKDKQMKKRVEDRLPSILQTLPFPAE